MMSMKQQKNFWASNVWGTGPECCCPDIVGTWECYHQMSLYIWEYDIIRTTLINLGVNMGNKWQQNEYVKEFKTYRFNDGESLSGGPACGLLRPFCWASIAGFSTSLRYQPDGKDVLVFLSRVRGNKVFFEAGATVFLAGPEVESSEVLPFRAPPEMKSLVQCKQLIHNCP